MSEPNERRLPWGVGEIDPTLQIDPGPPLRIRCVVGGCERYLIPPARGSGGEVCPEHGIRVHKSATYSYADPRRNVIAGKDLLADGIIGHPFTVSSHRFGYERGEDALSYSAMRAFQEAGRLSHVARYITGLDVEREPRLFLWGLELTDDSLTPFDLLVAARRRFERRLPVRRPATEPDIMLFLPGHYLILCEAKFCSPNTFYADGPRRDGQSLTKGELIDRYSDLTLPMLDRGLAVRADRVYYQLWRNTVFSEWMSQAAGGGTRAYFANLTRRGCETESFRHFAAMVRPEFAGRVTQLFWEELWVLAGLDGGRLSLFREYVLVKTANLAPAFSLGYF